MRPLMIALTAFGILTPLLVLGGAAAADPIPVDGCQADLPCEGQLNAAVGCPVTGPHCVELVADVPAPVGRQCVEFLPASEWPPPFILYEC